MLQNFIQYTNTIHKTIKFEANYSNTNIHFFDTIINLHKEGGITISLYEKPTGTCNLLHGDSFHPWSCKTGIIYSQALCCRRVITSDEELFATGPHGCSFAQPPVVPLAYSIHLIGPHRVPDIECSTKQM